jgi:hypothetical protein
MPAKPRQFTCPGCGRTKVTQVRRNLCSSCYERLRPRERKTLATCEFCERTRLAYHRPGLCPACYDQQRRRVFQCEVCKREEEAPALHYRFLNRRVDLPLHSSWAAWLWERGLKANEVDALRSLGVHAYRCRPDPPALQEDVGQAVRRGQLTVPAEQDLAEAA